MDGPESEHRGRIQDTHAQLDRFETQAAAISAVVLMLSIVTYTILLQVLL
jgi:hypothetical protein